MSEESFKQVRDRYRHLMQTVQEQADRAGRGGVDIANIRNMVNEANQTFPSGDSTHLLLLLLCNND